MLYNNQSIVIECLHTCFMKCGVHRNNHSYQRELLQLHRYAHAALIALVCAQVKRSEKDVDLSAFIM